MHHCLLCVQVDADDTLTPLTEAASLFVVKKGILRDSFGSAAIVRACAIAKAATPPVSFKFTADELRLYKSIHRSGFEDEEDED
jgi:hypothetical protein